MAEPTLYERLGGIFAIAAVIDNFSDRLVKNPKIVNADPRHPRRIRPAPTPATSAAWSRPA